MAAVIPRVYNIPILCFVKGEKIEIIITRWITFGNKNTQNEKERRKKWYSGQSWNLPKGREPKNKTCYTAFDRSNFKTVSEEIHGPGDRRKQCEQRRQTNEGVSIWERARRVLTIGQRWAKGGGGEGYYFFPAAVNTSGEKQIWRVIYEPGEMLASQSVCTYIRGKNEKKMGVIKIYNNNKKKNQKKKIETAYISNVLMCVSPEICGKSNSINP